MRSIFISYRRDDAEGEAGRLFDELTSEFGADKVFMDVTGIEPGRDFRKVIDQNVASCGVLLAIIGKGWIDAQDDARRRRLDDPLDFVRLETASALKRDIPVIPILVRGGRMPRSEQLPEDLKDLAYRNAVELTHARWDSDVQVLIKALRAHVDKEPEEAVGAKATPASARLLSKNATPALKEPLVGHTPSPAQTQVTQKSWRRMGVPALLAIIIAAGVLGFYDYKKNEDAKVRKVAADTAARRAAEDRIAMERNASSKAAAEQPAAGREAAIKAAADKGPAQQVAVRKAAGEKAAERAAPRKATEKRAVAEAATETEGAGVIMPITVDASCNPQGVSPGGVTQITVCAVKRRWSTAGVNPPGNWFASPGSNRSSGGGNEAAEAFGVEGRIGDSASVQAVT